MTRQFFFFLVFCTTAVFSQTQVGLSTTEFKKFKAEYGEMVKSDSYKAMRFQSKLIAGKMNGQVQADFKTREEFVRWISQNIQKTKFSSLQEAESMFIKAEQLTSKNMSEFKDVWEKFSRASQPQIVELMQSESSGEFIGEN